MRILIGQPIREKEIVQLENDIKVNKGIDIIGREILFYLANILIIANLYNLRINKLLFLEVSLNLFFILSFLNQNLYY
jgi:hypothetical protein